MKIIIDNGHGNNTPGKGSPFALNKVEPNLYLKEWEWCREIAQRIVRELKQKGYDATLLVPEKYDVSLSERVRRVNLFCKTEPCILISVHVNACGNGSKWMNATGWSIYTSKGVTKADYLAEEIIKEAVKCFKGKKIRYYSQAYLNRDFEENFYILKNTVCPAVLTENFFQDNVEDVKYILSEEGKKEVVRCHVNGIINYIKTQ